MSNVYDLRKSILCLFLCGLTVFSCVVCRDTVSTYILKSVNKVIEYNKTENENRDVETAVNEQYLFSPEGFGSGITVTEISDTPYDILSLMKDAEGIYKKLKKSGDIKEERFGTSSLTETLGDVDVNNKTSQNISLKELLDKKADYGDITKDEPYILIYHTHTTEGYELLDKGWYSAAYNSRTDDSRKNMVRVGEELAYRLEKAGFKVIHDKTVHDYSYTGAYDRSRKTVEKYLKKYPSIKITLDVHRDAIHYDSGVKCKPTAVINGKKAAQVMIISGCEGDGVTGFPQWKKNLIFALDIQSDVEESYNGLMRPIFFCNRKYNMDMTTCSLLLEFGTDANTLEEAVYSASLIGERLGNILNNEKNKGK